ncbi:DedA family protein [Candidatus Gromoviella agglomerans]|uniref:DedA family protein n=1 Tax=Candidatus Gromoviella agglomerans TaxID=2806609 RepID=UPI001E5631A5|nr:DedA family protein [Candidatus Gromoviella agglomerans]UFX98169.1 DedA family protein [Candidatus Gromoviella agglomerans]
MSDVSTGMIEFFKNYGYFAVFIGSMIEGETIIIAASVLSSAGHMSIYKVIFLAFLGSVISDQSCFLIGHKYGNRFLKKFPKFKKHYDKVISLLTNFETLFIFGFRFIYGVRNISPFIIGSAGVSKKKFFVLNILAAAIWAIASCLIGYYLGEFILNLGSFQQFISLGVIGFVFAGVFLWKIIKFIRNNKSK